MLLVAGLALASAGCATWPFTRLAPAPTPALLAEADRLADAGDYRAAILAYEQFLTRHPDDPAAPRALARRNTAAAIVTTREELGRLRDELPRLGDELAGARAELAKARAELAQARDEVGRARDELGRARDELGRARDELARRDGDLQRVRQELAARQADLERLKEIDLKLERTRR
jgi:septal ring factor EnvC (AmiA/AmiB activator)